MDTFRGTKFRDFDEREAIHGTALCAAVVRISTLRNENRNKSCPSKEARTKLIPGVYSKCFSFEIKKERFYHYSVLFRL